MELVLSLFPGIGLLDSAFEEEGFCVVRGPDLLWGGDVRRFHPPSGKFAGVIGGPPCQVHSTASEIRGTEKQDLIPEFVRVVREAEASWVLMENVPQAIDCPAIPAEWHCTKLRDWDCGGHTSRTRCFWTWPFMLLVPPNAGGNPEHSVMATTWKRGKTTSQYVRDKGFLPGDLPVMEYARLQGAEHIGETLHKHHASKAFAVHVLGNGVPLPMGRMIAKSVRRFLPQTLPSKPEQLGSGPIPKSSATESES